MAESRQKTRVVEQITSPSQAADPGCSGHIAGLVVPLFVILPPTTLTACSLDSGPFGTMGQQGYGAKLNDAMAKNPLLNLHIAGGTANAKFTAYGSVGGSGPGNPFGPDGPSARNRTSPSFAACSRAGRTTSR